MTETYIVVLGRASSLAFGELQTFFPSAILISQDVAKITTTPEIAKDAIHMLGGVIKIAEVLGTTSHLSASYFSSYLAKYASSGRIDFGISTFGKTTVPVELLGHIKEELSTLGVSSRYVLPQNSTQLSSVVVTKEKLVELIVVESAGEYFIAKTIAVQPFEQWAKRDFQRPHADSKAGMLPPKVARMAINLARPTNSDTFPGALLDPFCGMGTVLAEALVTGWNVVGSDISETAVAASKENLQWLIKQEKVVGRFELFTSDAVHVSKRLTPASLQAVVTEPFLGPPALGEARNKVNRLKIKNIIRGLEKLYIGCLKDWHSLLVPEGKVVIALPKYNVEQHHFFVKKVVDTCENFGYTRLRGPLEYSRPQAVVQREFFVFGKI